MDIAFVPMATPCKRSVRGGCPFPRCLLICEKTRLRENLMARTFNEFWLYHASQRDMIVGLIHGVLTNPHLLEELSRF